MAQAEEKAAEPAPEDAASAPLPELSLDMSVEELERIANIRAQEQEEQAEEDEEAKSRSHPLETLLHQLSAAFTAQQVDDLAAKFCYLNNKARARRPARVCVAPALSELSCGRAGAPAPRGALLLRARPPPAAAAALLLPLRGHARALHRR